MLRNICLITLSAFVLVFAAGSKTNPKEHGGDRGAAHELTGTITSHDESKHSVVIDEKDTVYYNDQTVFTPRHEKNTLLSVGSKVKIKYMNREGDKVAERVEMAPPENKRSSDERDTTKNKKNSAADDNEKDTTKNKSKSGTNDKDEKSGKDSKKHEKGEQDKDKERGKDRGAEPDSVPNPEHDRGEGW